MIDYQQIKEYCRRWAGYFIEGIKSRPDPELIRRQIGILYEDLGRDSPEVTIAESPDRCLALIKAAGDRLERRASLYNEIKDLFQKRLRLLTEAVLDDTAYAAFIFFPQGFSPLYRKLKQALELAHPNLPQQYFFDRFSSRYALVEYLSDRFGLAKKTERLLGWRGLARSAQCLCAYEKKCFVSLRPAEVHWQGHLLHNENGPAVRYRDGFAIWSLNGVTVSREIVETPPTEIDASLIYRERNVEVRREIVRKIGMEQLCLKLKARCLDREANYELLYLNAGDNRFWPYLKMTNPSTGAYHVEGVAPGIKTVREALAWRNGTAEKPVVLT